MDKQQKKQPTFQLGKEITKNAQKKVIGGATGWCQGKICVRSQMNCTTSPITSGYCAAVWPASGGVWEPCWTTWCY